MSEARAPHESSRAATADDLDQLVALAEEAMAEKRAQKGGEVWLRHQGRDASPRQRLSAAIDAADHRVALGLLDDAAVGYGVVRVEVLPDGGRLGVIDDVYVDPGCRAVGVGEVLMGHLLDWCREQGCFGVDSLALPGDRSTKNFFESFGLVARAIIVHRRLS